MIIIENFKKQFNDFFNINTKTENDISEEEIEITINSNFQLPIEYLEKNKLHSIPSEVSTDLELAIPIEEGSKTMYDILLDPDDSFSKQMIPNWNKQFTSDIDFLQDTQEIIKRIPEYQFNTQPIKNQTDRASILKIWKNTKENKHFLEKYNYMEWDMLKFLNQDSFFLQMLFFIHMSSPLIQFLIPIMLLIFPIIILKVSGVPFSTSQYLVALKALASQHTLGKLFKSHFIKLNILF